jgi:ATP-dependent Clp protease ATP-binding subunit ClpA
MTSNLGSELIRQESMGFNHTHGNKKTDREEKQKEMEEQIKDILHKNFRPEFLNRVDEMVIFHSLSRENLSEIIELQLEEIKQRVEEKGLHLKISARAKKLLGDKGYSPEFGARPLKRVMQKEILDKLALMMIKGETEDKGTISIDAQKDEMVLKPLKQKAAVKK